MIVIVGSKESRVIKNEDEKVRKNDWKVRRQ